MILPIVALGTSLYLGRAQNVSGTDYVQRCPETSAQGQLLHLSLTDGGALPGPLFQLLVTASCVTRLCSYYDSILTCQLSLCL